MAEGRKLQIPVTVDATGAKQGFQEIKDSARDMATAVQSTVQGAGKSIDGLGAAGDKVSKDVDRATSRIAQALQRQNLALESGGKQTAAYIEGLAKLKGANLDALQPLITQLKETEVRTAAAQARLVGVDTTLNRVGLSAKQTAAALRGVPAQFTDIVTSIASGQAPLTVLLQQGGQLKDMFGGVGNAARALGGYVTTLIRPFSLLAGAVATVAIGYYQGQKEALEFTKAIVLSGNAAGTTSPQLQAYAANVSKVVGTQAKAAEVLTALVASGRVGKENLDRFAVSAIRFESATGTAIDKIVENFADLGRSPVQASMKLNEQMNYLTASTYRQIKALEDEGKTIEAANLAQKVYADTIDQRGQRITASLGLIEKAWLAIKKATKEAGSAIMDVGRPSDELDDARTELQRRLARGPTNDLPNTVQAFEKGNEALRKRIAYLGEIARFESRTADREAAQKRQTDARAEFDKAGEEFLSKRAKLEREIAKARELATQAGASQVEIERRIADIREKFKESGAAGVGENEVASIKAATSARKQYLDLLLSQGEYAEKLTDGEKLVIKIQKELETSISGVTRAQKEKALEAAKEQALIDRQVANVEKQIKGIKESRQALLNQIDTENKAADSLEQRVKDQEAANATMGRSQAAIEAARASQMRLDLAQKESSQFDPAYIAALERKTAAQQKYADTLSVAEARAYGLKQAEDARTNEETRKTLELELSLVWQSADVREVILARRQAEVKLAKELAEIDKLNISEADKESKKTVARENARIAASNEATKRIVDGWTKSAEQINQTLTDALMRGFESGKEFATNLRDTISNMFKTLILRPIISFIVNPIAAGINGLVSGALGGIGLAASAPAAASTGSNILSGIGAAGSLANLGGGFMNGLSAWGAGGSVSGVLANPGLYTGAELAGVVAPPLLALAALAMLAKSFKGETRAGGQYGYAIDGVGQSFRRGTTQTGLPDGAFFLEGPSGGDPNQANAIKGVNTAAAGINSRFAALGSSSRITGFNAGYETSEKGRGGVFAGGTLSNGMAFGESGKGDNYAGTLYESTSTTSPDAKTAWENFTTDLLQVSIQALQADDGLPQTIKEIVKGIDAESLSSEAATALLATVDKTIAGVTSLNTAFSMLPFDALKNLSFDAAAGMVELAGSIETLQANIATYYQNFFSPEEQKNQTALNIANSLNTAGGSFSQSQILSMSRDDFRALVTSYEQAAAAGDEAAQKMLVQLYAVAGAFASIVPSAQDAAQALEQTNQALQQQAQAAQDAALSALRRFIGIDRETAQNAQQVAQERVSELSSLFDTLKSSIEDIRGGVDSTRTASGASANRFIDQALATARASGYLPDEAALSTAIGQSRSALSGSGLSQFEQDYQSLVLAGKLEEIQKLTGKQLTDSEKQLNAAETQIKQLDETLAYWEQAIALSRQTVDGITSMEDAIALLNGYLNPTKKPTTTGTPVSQPAGSATFGGRNVETPAFTIDENGFRRYADGSGSMLSEGELDLWKRGLLGKVPFYDVGTNAVQKTSLAVVHEGEAIIPKAFNPYLNGGSGMGDAIGALNQEVRGLRAEVQGLRTQVQDMQSNTRKTADILEGATEGGSVMRMREVA